MGGEIARTSDRDGNDWQVRIELRPEHCCLDHEETALSRLFWYWQERALLEDGLPSLETFRPLDTGLPWVEMRAENPMHFIMRDHPAGISGDWNDAPFAEYPVQMHGQACALEFLHCKVRREPTFVNIHQKIRGVERNYEKLSVPLSDRSGAVTRAVYAFRFVTFPVIHNEAA